MHMGIDIGTINCSVAILQDNKPMPVRIGEDYVYSMPSAVFAREDGAICIGREAMAMRMWRPECFRANFKRDFGTQRPYLLGNAQLTPGQIYVHFLRALAAYASDATGERMTHAVITHPANYGADKKRMLLEAATYAGLTDVELMDEPSAAALGYFADNMLELGEKLLVYDLGGGTFDVSLVEMTESGIVPITESLGLDDCGGTYFDTYIYQDIMAEMAKQHDLTQPLQNRKFLALVYDETIKLKHSLSDSTVARASIPIGYDYFEYELTQERFNHMIAGDVSRSCALVERIVSQAGLSLDRIDRALCVGGSTRIPYVVSRLRKTIGRPPLTTNRPELSVCLGAVAKGIEKDLSAGRLLQTGLQAGAREDQLHYILAAARLSNPQAQFLLGQRYYTGDGVSKNYPQAFTWYYCAAAQGYAPAQSAVADCYESGLGTNKDPQAARRWRSEAQKPRDL